MKQLRIIKDNEVSDDNVRGALQLDYIVYKDVYHLDDDKCIFYHRKNPMIYTMLIDTDGKICGYVNISPITDEAYGRLRNGEIDNFLTYKDLVIYEPGKSYNIYISSVVIDPEYRHQGYALKLLKEAFKKLKDNNIIISRVISDAVTDEGAGLVKKMGLKPIAVTDRGSVTYEKNGEPFTDFGR